VAIMPILCVCTFRMGMAMCMRMGMATCVAVPMSARALVQDFHHRDVDNQAKACSGEHCGAWKGGGR